MTRLTIVRHGNTFAAGEVPRRIGARTDPPLVPGGIAQGEALARRFAGTRFDRVLASPLLRTRETASLILRDQPGGPPIEPAAWLAEIDHGPDENQTDETIIARIGAAALARWDAEAIPPPGWHVDRAGRLAAWRALYAEQAGRAANVLIVTSNGSARFALMAQPALWRAARSLPSLKLRTGGWGTLSIDERGIASLLHWDRRPD